MKKELGKKIIIWEPVFENQEEIENPLQKYQHSTKESLVVNSNIHEIAPREGFSTIKILCDQTMKKWHSLVILAKVNMDIQ